jgi:hypothetical protein
VLPRLDLTHLVDCSGAYIPGHSTPTVILFGRNRAPISEFVRAVMGIRGEPVAPKDPARGLVWSAILAQTDLIGSASDFVSVADVLRTMLARHPWSIGGGGVSELKDAIEKAAVKRLGDIARDVGFGAVTREDDAYLMPAVSARRSRVPQRFIRPMVQGEDVRDFRIADGVAAIWPYDGETRIAQVSQPVERLLWPFRTGLSDRVAYGQTQLQRGLAWFEYSMFFRERYRSPLTIAFAFIATHNHFALDRGGKVFNRTAPIIKLPGGTLEEDHLALLGPLSSSTGCFWLKQVMMDKGNGGIGGGISNEPWERRMEVNAGMLERFPFARDPPTDVARALDLAGQRFSANLPAVIAARTTPDRHTLDSARKDAQAARGDMIALQEELDWRCYHQYELLDDAPEYPDPPPLGLGQRAFEIAMARNMVAGELDTTWFTRHRSTPITELPAHWPSDYCAVVERRIALIETDPNIRLVERPEYKRRWSFASWDEMEQEALRAWLLDRLEGSPVWADPAELLSTNQLADRFRHDKDFIAVAALYSGREDFGLEALVADLVTSESVPFLAVLRYADTGLRKRAQWEETWRLQRREDAIDAEVAAARLGFLERAKGHAQEAWRSANSRRRDETPEAYAQRMMAGVTQSAIEAEAERLIETEQKRRKKTEVGDIPVPPKYRSADFLSQDFSRLRGGLDVPKERFISFPGCSPDADGSLVVTWAGYDHLARATAIGTTYQARKDEEGWPAERLTPLLAGLQELLLWLIQWHNDYNAAIGGGMGDYFADLVKEEARMLGLTEALLAAWQPPAKPRKARGLRKGTSTA